MNPTPADQGGQGTEFPAHRPGWINCPCASCRSSRKTLLWMQPEEAPMKCEDEECDAAWVMFALLLLWIGSYISLAMLLSALSR